MKLITPWAMAACVLRVSAAIALWVLTLYLILGAVGGGDNIGIMSDDYSRVVSWIGWLVR